MNDHLNILGGGPAGASAALAALGEGARVRIAEKSAFPRHKVCGEFFSPEIETELERLGAWRAFLEAGPARVSRVTLHFGSRRKTSRLHEPAWGLSRHAFDALLLDRARAGGAEVVRDVGSDPVHVVATGRRAAQARRGRRLFGFKAHFQGPVHDAVELFFFAGCYVGVTAIESGRTNVCGLGPENILAGFGFDYDAVVRQCPALADRLTPLQRATRWISTGPLDYRQAFQARAAQYPAGDALSFVDPFTGTGLLAAVRSGALAGKAAARSLPPGQYLKSCRSSLHAPFQVARMIRKALDGGWAEKLVPLAPSRVLFALTRPR
jgi:flavin-dependent dehydrogenase